MDLGEWDEAGAVVKTKLRNEQLWNPARCCRMLGTLWSSSRRHCPIELLCCTHALVATGFIDSSTMLLEWHAKNPTFWILIASPFLDLGLTILLAMLAQLTLLNWWQGTCRVFVHLILPNIGMDALTKDTSNPGYLKNYYRRILGWFGNRW